jgi:MoxR-like ATPase
MLVEIEGVTLHLAHPDELTVTWVGQEEVMRQLLAAWLVVDSADVPMNPRLLGKPGVGKTTLAYAAAKRLNREVYIMQATVDTRPEDLLVTPVIEGQSKLRYVASPAGDGHAARRRGHSGRRQPHERKELGFSGAAAR